ncbi:MAG: hypothetical protein QG636_182 [Patescibacteria group bacterium]|jgi:hypothetical protein|nr:hypothetical protein [Patescibacteria group bacterium]
MDIWKHGTHIDLWSFVHLLSGALLALGFYGLGFNFVLAAGISMILLIVWEVFEWAVRIIESSVNVAVDVGIGILGFGVGAYWHYVLEEPYNASAFSVLLFVTLGMALWGFIDFHFRGYR